MNHHVYIHIFIPNLIIIFDLVLLEVGGDTMASPTQPRYKPADRPTPTSTITANIYPYICLYFYTIYRCCYLYPLTLLLPLHLPLYIYFYVYLCRYLYLCFLLYLDNHFYIGIYLCRCFCRYLDLRLYLYFYLYFYFCRYNYLYR